MRTEQVAFYGNIIEAVRDENGECWVSVRSVCEGIGVDWAGQWRKISSDPKFTCCHMSTHDSIGREQDMVCIPLQQLNGWLFSVNANKVKEDIRPKLLQYQQECMGVLYKHFVPRGEHDLSAFLARFDLIDHRLEQFDVVNKKLDEMLCISETVFGDDQKEIQDLVAAVAKVYCVDGRTVWGWVQTECDVSSYKKQNQKVKNFLKNKLGLGLSLVKKEDE